MEHYLSSILLHAREVINTSSRQLFGVSSRPIKNQIDPSGFKRWIKPLIQLDHKHWLNKELSYYRIIKTYKDETKGLQKSFFKPHQLENFIDYCERAKSFSKAGMIITSLAGAKVLYEDIDISHYHLVTSGLQLSTLIYIFFYSLWGYSSCDFDQKRAKIILEKVKLRANQRQNQT